MKSEYWPVLVVVAFVIYPFAMMAVCAGIVSSSGRVRFFLPVAKVFALFGCAIAAWFMLRHGLGKIPSVTVIGSAVFVLSAAATGGVLGSLVDLFVPLRDAHSETLDSKTLNDNGNVDGPPAPHAH